MENFRPGWYGKLPVTTHSGAIVVFSSIGKEKKTISINIFGRTVSGTNRNRPWDKWDPSPEQNGTRPWDKPAFLC